MQTLSEAGLRASLHANVCTSGEIDDFYPKNSKIKLKFTGNGKPFTLTLEVGLYALLDGIACREDLKLGELVHSIRRRRNPRHSLPEAACSFIAHYYYLKAHAPMQDALPVAFQAPPIRLKDRPYALSRPLLNAWCGLTGCWSARHVM